VLVAPQGIGGAFEDLRRYGVLAIFRRRPARAAEPPAP
jgi:hypothetical protein